jgi:hypothetical protein
LLQQIIPTNDGVGAKHKKKELDDKKDKVNIDDSINLHGKKVDDLPTQCQTLS